MVSIKIQRGKVLNDNQINDVAKKIEKKVLKAISQGYFDFMLCKKDEVEKCVASLIVFIKGKEPRVYLYLPLVKMCETSNFENFKLITFIDEKLADFKTIQILKLNKFVLYCSDEKYGERIIQRLKQFCDIDIKTLLDF